MSKASYMNMLWKLNDVGEVGSDLEEESSSGEPCRGVRTSDFIGKLETNNGDEGCRSASSVSLNILSSSIRITTVDILGACVGDLSSMSCEALVLSARFSMLFRKDGYAGYLRNTGNVRHSVLFLDGERTKSSSFARS